jgi:hypothetical protein
MGLTRIRAEQISDIDYKQAVRVVTVTNVTLSGGAPNSVDSVNLTTGDRILVTGQSTGSQNGLYQVQTVGAGSNGTWTRTSDGNQDGEIEAGMIVMVTEGTTYKDTQWKLTTNNPIVIGTTSLAFEQSSAYGFGTISANAVSVTADSVGDTLTLTAGDNISILGNNTSKTVTISVAGISLNSISNGTSNVNVVSSGGNVTVGVGGTANVATFSSTGFTVADTFVTGRVGSNLIPTTDITFSLGNATHRWSNLFLAGNTIYLGNSIITENAQGDIVIENSGAFGVPVGTTAQRSNVQGAIRFNTDLSAFEVYDGVTWNTVALGTISDFPGGDYGDVTTVTSDAFGVPLADTFDCNSEGALVTVDFEPLT